MADDDNRPKVVFELDLDESKSDKKLQGTKKKVQDLGKKENLKGLAEGFNDFSDSVGNVAGVQLPTLNTELLAMAPAVAAVAGAGLVLKTAFDMAIEAENIAAVNRQFEILTQNAGLAADTLRRGIEQSTRGWMDDDHAIKAANDSIIKLGATAAKVPEIFALARKAGLAFGIDSKQVMDDLVNSIASGNTRTLRRIGLNVDAAKAEKEYAKSIGVTAEALSQQGRQQALLNALLGEGDKKFQGIDESVKPLQTSIEKLKISFSQLSQAITEAIGGFVAPAFEKLAEKITSTVNTTRSYWNVLVRGSREAQDELNVLGVMADELRNKIAIAASAGPIGWANAALYKKQLEDIEKQIDKIESKRLEGDQKEYQRAARQAGIDAQKAQVLQKEMVDTQKLEEMRAKAEAQLAQLVQQRMNAAIELSNNEFQLQQAQIARREALEVGLQAKIKAIKESEDLLPESKTALIQEHYRQHEQALTQIAEKEMGERERMWDRYAKKSTGTMDGIQRGFKAFTQRNSLDLVNWGKMGEQAAGMLSDSIGNAFESMGAHAADGQNKMTSIVLGGLGDIASAYGSVMLRAGLFPPNPPVLAAGVALKALAGVLKSQGRSGGSSVSTDVGGGSGSGDIGGTSSLVGAEPTQAAQMSTPRREVTVNVQGSIIDTETKMRLLDMIRDGTDATDYRYQFVGLRGQRQ